MTENLPATNSTSNGLRFRQWFEHVLWVVYKSEKLESAVEVRKKFLGSYHIFKEIQGLFGKTWWNNQEKG
jgi:hypothetical protein